MNRPELIKIGIMNRAYKALVYGNYEKAFCLLRWARDFK